MPVEVAPACSVWPPALSVRRSANAGSDLPPRLWNGPGDLGGHGTIDALQALGLEADAEVQAPALERVIGPEGLRQDALGVLAGQDIRRTAAGGQGQRRDGHGGQKRQHTTKKSEHSQHLPRGSQPVLRPGQARHRSIGRVRHTPVLLVGVLLVWCLTCAAPSPGAAAQPRATTAAKAHPTVRESLDALLSSGQIDQAFHDAYTDSYDAAQRTLKTLRGTRFRQLKAVLATLDGLSAGGALIPGRLPLLFTTLDVNRRWWSSGPLLRYGQRPAVSGSPLVWQCYPGQGMQIQWLGTFGKANALFSGRVYDERLRGAARGGARAGRRSAPAASRSSTWFTFDGGRPPWVSGLAQGTALSALARGRRSACATPGTCSRPRGARDLPDRPPAGVRVDDARPAPTTSCTPTPRGCASLNGFVQALNGLHDFAALANDDRGRRAVRRGRRRAARRAAACDTGAWSRYSGRPRVRPRLPPAAARLPGRAVRAADRGRDACAPRSTATPPALHRRPDAPRRRSRYRGRARPRARGRPASGRLHGWTRSPTVTLTWRPAARVVHRPHRAARAAAGAASTGSPRAGRPRHRAALRAVDLAGNASAVPRAVADGQALPPGTLRGCGPWDRGPSSTRARAASARRRSPLPPPAAARPRACARSSCRPIPRTRWPTRSCTGLGADPIAVAPRPRGPAGLRAAGAQRNWASVPAGCRSARRPRCGPHLRPGTDRASRDRRALQPAELKRPPRGRAAGRDRRRLRADRRDAAAAVLPRRGALVAGQGVSAAGAADGGRAAVRPCGPRRQPARRSGARGGQRPRAQPDRDERDPPRLRARARSAWS